MPSQRGERPPKLDARVRRTHERLGSALAELIQEKSIDDVTVQNVLNRAHVGRSTFYLHFSDKNDLLLSQLEHFLETMSMALSMRQEASNRVAAVAEFFAHVGKQKKIYRSLAKSGRLNDFFDLAQGYFSRGIERRLLESKRLGEFPRGELSALASALAGSLLSLLKWWISHGAKKSPSDMDELFHRMVWSGVQYNSAKNPEVWEA